TRNLILASIFWGLTLYSYHSWRVFTLLFIFGLILINRKKFISAKNWIAGVVLLVFMLPLIFNINSVLQRSSDVSIFSEGQISGYFSNKSVSPLPPIADRLLDNKIWFILSQFFGNYLSYFSPVFIFTDGRSDSTYLNFPYFPLHYPIEVVFFITSIFIFMTQKIPNKNLLILWLVLAPIPASLATGAMNANRAPTFLPILMIISALGMNFFVQKWKYAQTFILIILVISFLVFINFYFIKLPQKPADNLRYGYNLVFKHILEIEKNYDRVVISKVFTEPQIFIAFYSKMDPEVYQEASGDWLRYEKSDKLYVDQLQSWNLGKFYFEDLDWGKKDSLRKNALIISKPEDFPSNIESLFDVRNPKGKIIYRLIYVNDEKI
ncbi:MAG: hypothetical protein AABX29_06005, partial [Nanoarchaeota archaeon]